MKQKNSEAIKNQENIIYDILVISFDFDGCLFNNFIQSVLLKKGITKNLTKNYNQIIDEFADIHHRFIKNIMENQASKILLVGSNRQDHGSDLKNFLDNDCKVYAMKIYPEIAKLMGAKFDNFLMADLHNSLKHGTAYEEILNKIDLTKYEEKHNISIHKSIFDASKLTLIFAQIHKIALENPGKNINFQFYDDKDKILIPLHDYFTHNPQDLPSNVTLRLFKYSTSIIQKNQGLPQICYEIQGAGHPNGNINYAEIIRKINNELYSKDTNPNGFYVGYPNKNLLDALLQKRMTFSQFENNKHKMFQETSFNQNVPKSISIIFP